MPDDNTAQPFDEMLADLKNRPQAFQLIEQFGEVTKSLSALNRLASGPHDYDRAGDDIAQLLNLVTAQAEASFRSRS